MYGISTWDCVCEEKGDSAKFRGTLTPQAGQSILDIQLQYVHSVLNSVGILEFVTKYEGTLYIYRDGHGLGFLRFDTFSL